MNRNSMKRSVVLLGLVSSIWQASATAQSAQAPAAGKMWPFEMLPMDYLERTHGFAPDEAWLEHARLSALKIEGVATASFVSSDGLVLTNQHCVRRAIEGLRHDGRDLNHDGFLATERGDEVPLRDMRLLQLIETHDVTADVLEGVDLAGPSDVVEERIEANRRRVLESAREEFVGCDLRIMSMYRGARFHLYVHEAWTDVRLVFTPHLAAGYFGGSTDNFSYPHFAADFAFLRAYRDGQPADTEAFHFTLAADPIREGQSIFVVGNPGATTRHHTLAERRWISEGLYRASSEAYRDMVRIHTAYLEEHPELRGERELYEFQIVTAGKYMHGRVIAFADADRQRRETAVETQLRQGLRANPELAQLCSPAFDAVDAAVEAAGDVYRRYWYQSPWFLENEWFAPLLRALLVVQAVHVDSTAADRADAHTSLARTSADTSELVRRFFAAHLSRARSFLGADDPAVRALLQGLEPAEAVERFATQSRIGDASFVRELIEGGIAAVEDSEDPAIVAAHALYPLRLANQAAVKEVDRVFAANARRVGHAVDALHGPEVCSEATFSLRLKDGVVSGYEQNGTWIPASNTLMGMYARAQEFPGHVDFVMPDVWRERMHAVDLSTPFNFVCTADAMGGSSGSAVLNDEGELVGVLYDGNAQFVENGFLYRDERARRSPCTRWACSRSWTRSMERARWSLS